MARRQILVCCYHKTGTALFRNILTKLRDRFGLRMRELFGMTTGFERDIDVVLLCHSQLGFELARPFRAIRMIRDPRDIWVSSYLYHRRCTEPWCINTNFDTAAPIVFPRVPISFQHRRERWKRDYLAGLGGRSYQRNLLDRDRDAGLAFELVRYTGCTLGDMRAWKLHSPDVLDVKLEDVAADFDAAMRVIFAHLGFTAAELPDVLEIAATEDIARMSDAGITANPHIHSRNISKWRDFLSMEQVQAFERLHGDVIVGLGYGLSGAPGATVAA